MSSAVADEFVSRSAMDRDGGFIAHRAGRHEDGGFLAQQVGNAFA